MTAIGKGDWIECVDASTEAFHAPGLAVGAVYQVEAVDVPAPEDGRRGLLIAGHRHPGNILGIYRPGRFKPIHPGGALTRLLMEPVSDRIEPGVSRKSRQGNPATADQ